MSTEALTSNPGDREEQSRRPANLDETYARYEGPPFRNYSLKPSQGNQDDFQRKQLNSLMNRFSSIRSKMGGDSKGKKMNGNSTKSDRPKPDYSLAGPKPNDDDDYESYNSDEGFGDYGRRLQATIGLAKPFPRQKRGGRWRKNKNPPQPKRVNKGERTEPGSESGKPEGQVGITVESKKAR